MKKILLTVLMIIAAIPMVLAQGNRSILKIRLSDNSPITVAVDRRYYDEHNRVITIGNFPAGRHTVRVFRWSSKARRRVLVYDGVIRLQPGTMSYMVIDRYSGVARFTNSKITRGQIYKDDDRSLYDWDRNNGYRNDQNGDDIYNDNRRHDDDRNGNYNDDNGYGNYNNDYGNSGNQMRANDMEDLRTRVSDRITDTDKMKLMQSVLANRYYTTDQVRQMLSWISFESTRLEFAKWAYANVTDKRNYWKLEDQFTFGSSKDEFNDYISNKR